MCHPVISSVVSGCFTSGIIRCLPADRQVLFSKAGSVFVVKLSCSINKSLASSSIYSVQVPTSASLPSNAGLILAQGLMGPPLPHASSRRALTPFVQEPVLLDRASMFRLGIFWWLWAFAGLRRRELCVYCLHPRPRITITSKSIPMVAARERRSKRVQTAYLVQTDIIL